MAKLLLEKIAHELYQCKGGVFMPKTLNLVINYDEICLTCNNTSKLNLFVPFHFL